jgi:hypothetical protein
MRTNTDKFSNIGTVKQTQEEQKNYTGQGFTQYNERLAKINNIQGSSKQISQFDFTAT